MTSTQCIHFKCDNMAVVHLLIQKMCVSNDKLVMHLIRCLSFYSATYHFHLKAEHSPGVCNTAVDAIYIMQPFTLSLSCHTESIGPYTATSHGSPRDEQTRLRLTSLNCSDMDIQKISYFLFAEFFVVVQPHNSLFRCGNTHNTILLAN